MGADSSENASPQYDGRQDQNQVQQQQELVLEQAKPKNQTKLIEKQSQFALLNHRESLSTLNERTEYQRSQFGIQENDTLLTRQLKLQFREAAKSKAHDMFK